MKIDISNVTNENCIHCEAYSYIILKKERIIYPCILQEKEIKRE